MARPKKIAKDKFTYDLRAKIPADMHERLTEFCDRTLRLPSEVVRQAVLEYLARVESSAESTVADKQSLSDAHRAARSVDTPHKDSAE